MQRLAIQFVEMHYTRTHIIFFYIDQHPGNNCVLFIELFTNRHLSAIKKNNYSIFIPIEGLDINVCPIPVKTDVRQVDLVLRLSDGTSEKIRDSQTCRYDGQIYFHWYKILGLLYKRALFALQFVHNLF